MEKLEGLPSPESKVEAAKIVLRKFFGRLLDIPWFSPTEEPNEEELQELVYGFYKFPRFLPLRIIKDDWLEIIRLLEVWHPKDYRQVRKMRFTLAKEGTIMRRAQNALFESINGTPADNRETALKLMYSISLAVYLAIFDAVPFKGKGRQKMAFCGVLIDATQIPDYSIPDTLASLLVDKISPDKVSEANLRIFAKGY